MSFLDDLENNLKSLESAEEGREAAERQARLRERDRAAVQAAAPWAETLKQSPFTAELLVQAARVGSSLRVKVRVAWLGSTLRLDDAAETRTEPLDLAGSPEALVRAWLA